MSTHVRVRFAPSPTGFLHIGGARTCFFNWLFAQKMKGSFILRIEDTDQVRSTFESEQKIISDLQALNFTYDEGPNLPAGKFAPYRQSERLSIYAHYARQLLHAHKAYYCFCSDETLTKKREIALKLGRAPHYDGTCAHLSSEEVQEHFDRGKKASLRFRVPMRSYKFYDHVRGDVEFKEGMVGDFLITRTALDHETKLDVGFPVYNFCCVIDDALMEMTHVIRAEEHLSNTARQLMLYEALGFKTPEFAHISLILGPDRQKLSKRSGDVSVHEYLAKGYLPEALLNFLLLLGWSPKVAVQTKSGHPEIFSIDEMLELFSLEGLQKAGAVFDVQKLNWMNGYYLSYLPLSVVVERVKPFLETPVWEIYGNSWFESYVALMRTQCVTLKDFSHHLDLLIADYPQMTDEVKVFLSNHQESTIRLLVPVLKELLLQYEQMTEDDVAKMLQTLSQKTSLKGKGLFMPLRVLLTGQLHGPELKCLIPLLGKVKALKRLEYFSTL
jgi:nondiscriminating glutamyl-tRNA synthetase